MSVDAWVTLGALVLLFAGLATDRVSPVVGMSIVLMGLLLSGTIDDSIALGGLSSPATITIAALYVVAAAVSTTGGLSRLVDTLLLGRHGRIGRLAGSTVALSAFMPNTPLVALAAPRVVRWSRRHGRSASRYLMPLSFASILGGVVTILGTSTNLVVSDALRSSGAEPLGVFEMTPVGLPVAIAGVLVMIVTVPFLLRERVPAGESMRSSTRRFQIQMVVTEGGPLDGMTIAHAGLRDLDALFLAAVERAGRVVTASPELELRAGDHLHFVGDVGRIVDLQDIAGLVSAELPHLVDAEGPGVRLYEAVVAGRSDLAGRTLKEAGFRSRYGAAVLAMHRSDGDLRGKLGRIDLQVGDVLLVLAGPDFGDRWREHGDFSLVASVDDPPPARRSRAWVATSSLALIVVLASTGVLSLLAASLLAAGLVIVGGALSMTEARHAIDLNVVLTIALSISIGLAVESTGLAAAVAGRLTEIGGHFGVTGLLFVTIVTTQVLTELLSNSGAAAIMAPVAMATAVAGGSDPRHFAIGVLIGASCSFLTPVGYQTNLMVYSLGGYRFTDFTRVGFPLTITSAVTATAVLSLL